MTIWCELQRGEQVFHFGLISWPQYNAGRKQHILYFTNLKFGCSSFIRSRNYAEMVCSNIILHQHVHNYPRTLFYFFIHDCQIYPCFSSFQCWTEWTYILNLLESKSVHVQYFDLIFSEASWVNTETQLFGKNRNCFFGFSFPPIKWPLCTNSREENKFLNLDYLVVPNIWIINIKYMADSNQYIFWCPLSYQIFCPTQS